MEFQWRVGARHRGRRITGRVTLRVHDVPTRIASSMESAVMRRAWLDMESSAANAVSRGCMIKIPQGKFGTGE